MSRPLVLAGLLFTGCGGGVIQRVDALPPPPAGTGFVHVRCTPADVDVYIDDAYAGRLDGYPDGVLRARSGARRIKLHKVGHYAWYGVVEAGPTPVEIVTHLVAEPAPEPGAEPDLKRTLP